MQGKILKIRKYRGTRITQPFRNFSYLQKDDDKTKASELSLANVGGVFVVLLAGMGLACLIAVFEFIWKSRKMASDDTPVRIRQPC